MRTDSRDHRLEQLRERGYRLIFDVGTPRSVARGIGLVLFVAEQRERDDQAKTTFKTVR